MKEQLSNYIKEQTALGVPRETIIQNLKAQGGWSEEEIQKLFVPADLPPDNRKYGKVSLVLSVIVYTILLILYSSYALFLGPLIALVLFFALQVFFFKKNKITSQLSFALIPFFVIGSSAVLRFSSAFGLQAPLIIPILFFIVLLVCVFSKSTQRNALRFKILFQIILFLLITLFYGFYAYEKYIKKPIGEPQRPCVTGQYNPATKSCE